MQAYQYTDREDWYPRQWYGYEYYAAATLMENEVKAFIPENGAEQYELAKEAISNGSVLHGSLVS